ncbi:MAG: ribonuclease III [Flavobacteriaceae bacterium]
MQFFPKIWLREEKSPSLDSVLKEILGFTPKNKSLYQTAFTHRSVNHKNEEGIYINFERLEFLGDSVIDTVVAHHLYSELNHDDEGELTKMKSKIVSREKLNFIGKEIGLLDHLHCTGNKDNFGDDINGNILEALIGAVFIDKGYERCKKVVFKLILDPHISLNEVKKEIISYKSVLIEWGQKEKQNVQFLTEKEDSKDSTINYYCKLMINDQLMIKVREVSKKKAEEKAAKRAYKVMRIKDQI